MRSINAGVLAIETIRLRPASNRSIAIVRIDTSIDDTMKALISNERVLYQQYGLHFENTQTREIARDSFLTDRLSARSRSK